MPDAGSYAAVILLIDELTKRVHVLGRHGGSFLASYGGREALKVAEDLDSKVETLLTAAAK